MCDLFLMSFIFPMCMWQDSIDAIEDVVYYIKPYDVTTIRASTPMFLISLLDQVTGNEDGALWGRF